MFFKNYWLVPWYIIEIKKNSITLMCLVLKWFLNSYVNFLTFLPGGEQEVTFITGVLGTPEIKPVNCDM